ncbi:MAG: FeoB-associated Cys-rich membrane protein [Armatimonadota bacterium]
MWQEIIVGVILAAAVVWLVFRALACARRGGCGCDSAASCPYVSEGECAPRDRACPLMGRDEKPAGSPDLRSK